MRILQVTYENFKNIKNGQYDLNGKSIFLIADNTFGKTNFLRGLRGVLGANPGKNLITTGEDKATVTALLAEFENDTVIDNTIHTFKMVVKRDKGGDEKVTLQVKMPDGTKDDTKTMVGKIAGEIELGSDFVQLGKTAEGRNKQLEIVKSYLDQDIIDFLKAETGKLKKHYDQRTEEGREVVRLKALIESSGLKYSDFDMPKDPKPTEELQTKITNASTHNTQYKSVVMRIEERIKANEELAVAVAKIEEEIYSLTMKIEVAKSHIKGNLDTNLKAKEWLKENTEIDVAGVQEELTQVTEYNATIKRVNDARKWKAELEASESKVGELTALYESSKEAISNSIRDMNHPIPGLSFDADGQVFYNGKKVSEDHLSFAEQQDVNIALKLAKNPNAKVIFLDNGESIGLDLFQKYQEYAKANGYQIVAEKMVMGKKQLIIEMMPDYTQIAVNK